MFNTGKGDKTMNIDILFSSPFSQSLKNILPKLRETKIWDFSWINLFRIEDAEFGEIPVYVNDKNKLIFECNKMKTGKFYDIEWEKMNLLIKKEKDGAIIFYELIDDKLKERIKEFFNTPD